MKSRDLLMGILLTLAAVGQIVLGFVFYDSQGSDLWRNIGWGVGYLSAIFGWLPMYELKKRGGVEKGHSYIQTSKLVDSGIYAIVRHPQYLAGILISIAVAMIAQHWLVTVIGAIAAIIYFTDTFNEEQRNITKFGNAYKQYQQKVPRVNFLLGFIRWISRKFKG